MDDLNKENIPMININCDDNIKCTRHNLVKRTISLDNEKYCFECIKDFIRANVRKLD